MRESLIAFLEFTLIRLDDFSLSVYHVLSLALLYAAGHMILWAIGKTLRRRWSKKKINEGSEYALMQMIKYLVWIIVLVLGLESMGIKVTILIAGSAALLVGVGLGLQQTFNDIVSGIILLVEGSVKVGDILDVNGEVVKVRRIGLRTSIVENRNEIIMVMPNSKIVTDQVVNWNYNNNRARFKISVGVAYGSDTELVSKILAQCAQDHHKVHKEKRPFARLTNFGSSSLDFELFFWSNDLFRIDQVKSEIRNTIVSKFKENDIVIPFPQRDVHIMSMRPG